MEEERPAYLMTPKWIETLARWACMLNSWEWPDDMPGKPKTWDKMPAWFHLGDERRGFELCKGDIIDLGDERRGFELCKGDIIDPLRELIELIIGKKETFRWHHLNKCNMTLEQHEAWWEKRHKNA
jgi:hypothetical protein